MKVEPFLAYRPCPCSCDGYVQGLRLQLEAPEIFPVPTYPAVDADVLGPILRWRAEVMAGRSTPSPEEQARCTCFTYQHGRRPTPKVDIRGKRADVVMVDEHFVEDDFAPLPPPARPRAAPASRFGPKPPARNRFGGSP